VLRLAGYLVIGELGKWSTWAVARRVRALCEELEDEYRALATYRKVIDTFGPVRPFVNIVAAEERDASGLLELFERFGVKPPEDTWPGRVTAPRTRAESCRAGVEAEIENEATARCVRVFASEASVSRSPS
jgi:hypothetical protein